MAEPITLDEKYCTATLSPIVNARRDVLVAAATAAARPRHRIVLTLWRLKDANDSREWHTALEELARMAKYRLQRKHGMTASIADLNDTARLFLNHYVFPNCVPCQGSGHLPEPNAPQTRSSAPCHHCGGSGSTSLRKRAQSSTFEHKQHLVDTILWLNDEILELEQDVRRMAYRRLQEKD